jgi:glycosyltransferase involved in cell wall biosynthesis
MDETLFRSTILKMPTSISLVMTVYNRQGYLSQAIDSILAQTYPHWHLVVWDDGSNDESPQIARQYADTNPRIQFIPAPHTGRSPALVNAIAATPPHPYLAFMDSDDLLDRNALAATVDILDRHADVGAVYSDYLLIDERSQVRGVGSRCQIPYSKDRLLVDFMTFQFRLLRREVYDRVGGIDRDFQSAEDYDLCLKLSEVTEFYHLQKPLYYYRKHTDSVSVIGKKTQIEYSGKAVNNALQRRGLTDRYRFSILPTGQCQLEKLPDKTVTSISQTIPKIIHQTWKDKNLPPYLALLQRTWQEHHPEWEFKLWTDADNRAFLAEHYPWFLPIYDGYDRSICKVDAVRYFWLYHYGGVYIDLDFECLSAIDPLLTGRSLVLSLEPQAHTIENHKAKAQNFSEILSPAWMASVAKHPFWEHIWQHLTANKEQKDPLDATGPFLLTRAYQTYSQTADITLIPASKLHPMTLAEIDRGLLFDLQAREKITREALAIHHWLGSWWKKSTILDDKTFTANFIVSVLEKGRVIIQGKFSDLFDRSLADRVDLQPLVSCLMVTKNRANLAKRAIFCFLQQTYSNKELIIIDDGENNDLEKFIRQFPHSQITYYRLPSQGLTLGELRNISVAKATGTYLCQWDDDDLYDPLRLELQMAVIQSLKVDGCLLDNIYIWFPHQQLLAKSFRRTWEGTLLCRKDIFPSYPNLRRGEDTEVVTPLIQNYHIATLDRSELYLYCFHQNNTWNLEHFDRHWRSAPEKFEDDAYLKTLKKLALRLPIHSYLQSLQSNFVQINTSEAIEVDSLKSSKVKSSDRCIESVVDTKPSTSKIGINVSGFLNEGFGINEGVNYCLKALEADRIPHVFNQFKGADIPVNPHRINLIHANPDMLLDPQQQILSSLGDRYFQRKYNIGYWVWESRECFPQQWLKVFKLFNEIWTPTSYSQQAIASVSPIPVVTIPHSISLPETSKFSRQDLGWTDNKFVFLFIYDPLSLAVRKNPEGVINAFKKAFDRADDRVSLVIKTKGLSSHFLEKLKQLTDDRPQIEIINENYDRDRLNALLYHCDCYISLHRSEGFGLTLAEAMFYGKPTITTGFSGNLDFTNSFNSFLVDYRSIQLGEQLIYFGKETVWAEPNLDRASEYMRLVVDNPDLSRKIGAKAAKDIQSQFSPKAIASKIQRRLQAIESEF